jgi:hypothetical protein
MLALFTTIILLAGCQADESNAQKSAAQPIPTSTPQTSSDITIPPQYPQTPSVTPPSQTVAAPTNDIIYKCILPDGTAVYSDKNCGSLAQSMNLIQSRAAPKKPPVPAYTYTPPTVTPPSSNTSTQPHKASSYEINTRYDNLSREINSLFEYNEKPQLNHALLVLEQDRNDALSMKTGAEQSHDINTRFDNMAREIRAHNKNKALAHQLLELERMRNQALYTY